MKGQSGTSRPAATDVQTTQQTQQPAGLLITMTVFKDNNSEQSDKVIVAEKPSRMIIYHNVAAAAKANTSKLCDCHNSEPGKISLDIFAHESGCHIRKRLQTGRYTVNTSVTPRKISDGFSLGVAIGGEDY